jgi:rubrerythrin
MERVHAQMVQRAIEERRFASSGASSLAQAVGQVIELERSALDFYEKILQRVTDPGAKKFFADMVALEQSHDVAIEKLKSSLQAGSIALRAKELIGSLETAPCWFYSEDEDLEKLLKMAVDFENAASRFYLAVAEHLDGEEATILRELGLAEEEHGRILWDALRHRIPPLV